VGNLWHNERVGITQAQLVSIQKRLAKGHRTAQPVLAATEVHPAGASHQRLLGIDPSLRGTGYGVVELGPTGPVSLTYGTIACPAGWERSRCLVRIAQVLREVIQAHQPTVCAVEGLFFAQNLQTAILMGEARGASLLAAAEAGLEIYEIAPRKVKQAMVGYGAAQKLAVAKMVQRLLKIPSLPEPDAADALALALTFAQERRRFSVSPLKRL
jgi:crossover junction endodeoxyribonuclease RuvC